MLKKNAKEVITHLFRIAGVIINGSHAWDIQIHNEDFYQRVLHDGEMGLGESYVDGWWDCQRIDMLVDRLFEAESEHYIRSHGRFYLKLIFARVFNFQSRRHAFEIGRIHYDLGNLLFEAMLGPTMSYTSGYWPDATTLEEAQMAKYELSAKKLLLEPGMRVLDLNCGWGGFARYLAENYGVQVVGFTISKQQYEYARKHCLNLPIEIFYQDFHDITENFDRIVSMGMFQFVGPLNHRHFMQKMHNHLMRDGIFLLHTIGSNQSVSTTNGWINKYIFPDETLPSISQIGKATERLLIMEDWHNFGLDCDKTLMTWHKNFNARWDGIKVYYDDRFYRMWNYYLLSCAGGFRARAMQVWQIVLSRSGIKDSYRPVR
jgi:cyclopropane-fatty-acyl-phospholipid synthase